MRAFRAMGRTSSTLDSHHLTSSFGVWYPWYRRRIRKSSRRIRAEVMMDTAFTPGGKYGFKASPKLPAYVMSMAKPTSRGRLLSMHTMRARITFARLEAGLLLR